MKNALRGEGAVRLFEVVAQGRHDAAFGAGDVEGVGAADAGVVLAVKEVVHVHL